MAAQGPGQDPRGADEVPDRREAHQGGDRLLHRPRGPLPHARLRQEVPAEVGRQPDVRRLVDPRLLAPGRVRPAPGHRLAGLLLAARRRVRPRQGARVRRRLRPGRHAVRGRPARAAARRFAAELRKKDMVAHVANEIEGFIFKGRDAERRYFETGQFEYVSTGGYYHSLPGDTLRRFIDTSAEVQRALGFANEKDHPEVAPSQFEMNYGYTEAVVGADQVQLYKLIARQVAAQMDLTACFLPKPVAGVNGNGCTPTCRSRRRARTSSTTRRARTGSSSFAWNFINRILANANDICLILNSSVNSYRRLDPHFEAPEPDQGLGQRPRLDGAHPDRQRAHGAHRGALDRPGRQPVPGDLLAVQDRARGAGRRGRQRRQALAHALPARQHLRRDPAVQGQQVRAGAARRRGAREVRRAEAGLGGALRQGARRAREARARSSSTTRSRTSTSGRSSRPRGEGGRDAPPQAQSRPSGFLSVLPFLVVRFLCRRPSSVCPFVRLSGPRRSPPPL